MLCRRAGLPGHWDEEVHGLDYLVYAYLQKGDNVNAEKQIEYLKTIHIVQPVNFKVAYAFAAIPCRYVLENKKWHEAPMLEPPTANISWDNFPWQEAMIHFTRLLGNVHVKNIKAATVELAKLNQLHDTLQAQKDSYKSMEVAIQMKAGEAWIQFVRGHRSAAVKLMRLAADMEDSVGKHPVTPGEVLPARELLGDLYVSLNDFTHALQAYEQVLQKTPNRFNSVYGAALASQKMGNEQKGSHYYRRLWAISDTVHSDRNEIARAKKFLAAHERQVDWKPF